MNEKGTDRAAAAAEAILEENRLIAERRAKLAALRQKGIAFPNDFRRTACAGDLHAAHAQDAAEALEQKAIRVKVAGRIMARRIMGKVSFVTLADPTGRIQLFLQRDGLPEGQY